jgi:hypothetical protein
MGLAIAIIGALAAVAAAVAAFGSWSAARKANESAASIAAIERDRRHDEMIPQFDITCTVRETAPDCADLHVILTGGRLERLARVTVTIQDEAGKDHWASGLPDGVTRAEAEAFVWGPWEFNTGASAQVVSNRESRPRTYSRVSGKNWDLLVMRRTRSGTWMSGTSQDEWRSRWQDQPVRLLVTCQCEGYEPWFEQRDVPVVQGGEPGVWAV